MEETRRDNVHGHFHTGECGQTTKLNMKNYLGRNEGVKLAITAIRTCWLYIYLGRYEWVRTMPGGHAFLLSMVIHQGQMAQQEKYSNILYIDLMSWAMEKNRTSVRMCWMSPARFALADEISQQAQHSRLISQGENTFPRPVVALEWFEKVSQNNIRIDSSSGSAKLLGNPIFPNSWHFDSSVSRALSQKSKCRGVPRFM